MSRVLLVDDDADALHLRQRIFEHHGHQVTSAVSAAAARPEAVILDLRLPSAEDGLALIREFRASSPHLKIVVVSGCTADLDGRPERALADAILQKPVRSEVLLASL